MEGMSALNVPPACRAVVAGLTCWCFRRRQQRSRQQVLKEGCANSVSVSSFGADEAGQEQPQPGCTPAALVPSELLEAEGAERSMDLPAVARPGHRLLQLPDPLLPPLHIPEPQAFRPVDQPDDRTGSGIGTPRVGNRRLPVYSSSSAYNGTATSGSTVTGAEPTLQSEVNTPFVNRIHDRPTNHLH